MLTAPACHTAHDKLKVLRFASLFLWADLEVASTERAFMLELADELDVGKEAALALLDRPPRGDDIDPTRLSPRLADVVRQVALRAIAADGRVAPAEMHLFDLLDELLPAMKHQTAEDRVAALVKKAILAATYRAIATAVPPSRMRMNRSSHARRSKRKRKDS